MLNLTKNAVILNGFSGLAQEMHPPRRSQMRARIINPIAEDELDVTSASSVPLTFKPQLIEAGSPVARRPYKSSSTLSRSTWLTSFGGSGRRADAAGRMCECGGRVCPSLWLVVWNITCLVNLKWAGVSSPWDFPYCQVMQVQREIRRRLLIGPTEMSA